ncbi:MAG: metallophosphoesterase family protein [Nitrospirae bacterium]|nr:metallophosphoesterase family protein [Nitrospirota bacterium]
MRIGVISDVHGNYEALTAVLREIDKEGVDLIVNSGDNIGYSAFPNECVSILSERNVASVMGNYDDAGSMRRSSPCTPKSHATFRGDSGCGTGDEETNRIRFASLRWTQERISEETSEYLSSLPVTYGFRTGNGKTLMFHGGPENLTQWITADDYDLLASIAERNDAKLVIMGHTHKPFSRQIKGTLFVNPGAVGRPFDGDPRASFAIIDAERDLRVSFRRVGYDVEKNIRALVDAGLPPEIGIMLRNGRDSHIA